MSQIKARWMRSTEEAKTRRRRTRVLAAFWVLLYAFLIVSPSAILLLDARSMNREFLRELSVMLAFVGLALMGLQFVPMARPPFLTGVFDMDAFYSWHHKLSLVAFAFILAHPILLFVNNPYTLTLLNVVTAPWRARAAVAATVALIALVLMSVWRRPLEIAYERWHWLHDLFSVLAAGLALYHVFKVNYYTSNPTLRILWIVLACLWGAMVVYARVVRPLVLSRRPYRVAQIVQERGAAWTLSLEPVGHRGLSFRPGQFAWLQVWRSSLAIEHHPFSFSSSAERSERIEFTIKELGDWTAQIKDVRVGQRVYIDGPYGTFGPDVHPAPGFVFLAGGIGSAPILSMLRTLADRRDERPLLFFYGSRTWEEATYREEIKALRARLNLQVVHALEEPPQDWKGETGFITRQMLDRYLPGDRKNRQYFVSGPLPMIDSVEASLRQLGIPRNRIQSEKYEMA
jgi:predicted ferric reductase